MGTFLGHILPGLALTTLGLWHTINTIKAYFLMTTEFSIRFWHPVKNARFPNLKHLELLLILFFSVLAICIQVFEQFRLKMDSIEHATMFLHIVVFSSFNLLTDITGSNSEIFSGILAVSVFAQELFLLHFHSNDHIGIEGHYHFLLQIIVFVSLLSATTSNIVPNNFSASLVLSVSVLFQGIWFLNMGFMLWVPDFVPKGCYMKIDDDDDNHMVGAVICRSHKADLRARAMANLQFSWIICGILGLTGLICLKSSRGRKLKEYEELHDKGVTTIDDGFKQENLPSFVVCEKVKLSGICK